MADFIFEISDLSLSRGSKEVLRDVTMNVPTASMTMVIGPSGSGKSTLLRVFNRLLEPPADKVFLKGQDITKISVLSLRRQVGMVFQQPAMLEGSVAENIASGPKLVGESLSQKKLARLLDAVSLPQTILNQTANSLSGGEAQRVALARTLATSPEVLLLDEPTASLDPQATRQVEGTLQKLNQEQGLTLVWVSHDIEQTRRVGQHVILLQKGVVKAAGPVMSILNPNGENNAVLDFVSGSTNENSTKEILR